MKYNNKRIIYIIVAVFTLIQFAIILKFGYTPYPDSDMYIINAQLCIADGCPYPSPNRFDIIGFIWNVGSINIVELFLLLFHSVTPLLYVYALMKGLSALLVYKLSEKIFNDDRGALIALIIYVLYPANYGESTSVLSELPFVFFILLGLWLSLKNNTVAGGAIIAIANWIRPMGIVFIATLVVYFLVVRKRKEIFKTVSGYVIVILIIGSLSYARTGYFIYQAKTGWMALLQYSVDNSPEDDAYYMNSKGLNPVQRDSLWQRRMVSWVVSHPKDYIQQMPKKLAKTFVSDNANFCTFLSNKKNIKYLYNDLSMRTLTNDFPHYSWVQWLTVYNLIYYYALLIIFVCGSICLLRRRRFSEIVIPLGVVFFGVAILLFFGHGEARFHIPFMPFIIMVAASWIVDMLYSSRKLHLLK